MEYVLDTNIVTTSARNMGKNDLWIAAACTILGATLLTTDKDFMHLDKTFFEVQCVIV